MTMRWAAFLWDGASGGARRRPGVSNLLLVVAAARYGTVTAFARRPTLRTLLPLPPPPGISLFCKPTPFPSNYYASSSLPCRCDCDVPPPRTNPGIRATLRAPARNFAVLFDRPAPEPMHLALPAARLCPLFIPFAP